MSVQHIEVSEADDGQRLDRWLKKQMSGVPSALIFKLIRTGQVRVDGKRAKAEQKLSTGQDIRLPPVKQLDPNAPRPISAEDKKFMESLVLYDDGDVLVINKPGDIATQGGSKTTRHIDALLPALANKDGLVPRLTHRLDKETSGVLLLARAAKSVRSIGFQFKNKEIEKTYFALCAGLPAPQEGTVKAPLAKRRDKMVIDKEEGQSAVTDYKVADHAGKRVSFVIFEPETGRTHQIRAHSALVLNCPIIGDTKYGYDPEGLDTAAKTNRVHLHAAELSFAHPGTGKKVTISADLPSELTESWKAFGLTSRSL